jgi:hypothetical protein
MVAASRESAMLALERTSLREGLNTMVSRAREWLNTHGGEDPDQAGMDELKQTNPDAFAIVQALITKKSLGLLNPKHPNAFGGYNDAPGQGTMSTVVVDDPPAVPVATVATGTEHATSGSHQDFFNWKPHENDDAMVSDVLGEVAQIKNGGATVAAAPVEAVKPQPEPQIENHDAGMVELKDFVKDAKPVVQAQESQAPSNPYMQNLTPTASMSQEASSVKVAFAGKHNALSSFSWDDDDSAPTAPSTPKATGVTAPASPKNNALENFLR